MRSLLKFVEPKDKFNDKLLNIKKNDDIMKYLDAICKNLEHINIKYLGSDKTEYYFDDTTVIDVNISRLDDINMKFHIDGYDIKNVWQEKDINLNLKFFKLIDNHFYYNGVRYTPILQFVENFYVRLGRKEEEDKPREKVITLKTMLIALSLEAKSTSALLSSGKILTGYNYTIYVFSKRINFLYYFLAEFGWEKALSLLGIDSKDIMFMTTKDITEKYPVVIELNKKISMVYKKEVHNQFTSDILLNILDVIKLKSKKHGLLDVIYSNEFWSTSLGEFISKSNSQLKGEKLLVSFKKILDDVTKESLASTLKLKIEDISIYEVIKYMVKDYYNLRKRNNLDLKYKRLRFFEYMVVDFAKKLSEMSSRIIRKNTNLIKDKENIAKIHPNYLIKSNISGNELIRYDGGTSMIAIFDLMRVSYKGPQSISKSSSDKYRGLHPSYLNRVSLIYASANDPGVTTTLTPFAKITDKNFFEF